MISTTNHVALEGNLTRDPSLRYTPRGSAVVDFSIASNRYYRDSSDGRLKEATSYFDCRLFGERARNASKQLQKGFTVHISGRLEQERWRDRDGHARSRVFVIVDQYSVLRKPRRQPSTEDAPMTTEFVVSQRDV